MSRSRGSEDVMGTTDLVAVLMAAALMAVILWPRSRRHVERVPEKLGSAEEPPNPLPPDQRAHLAWLADTSRDSATRRTAVHMLAVDDARRGRERGYRPREP